MSTSTSTITTEPNDEIDRAILDALRQSSAELIPWAALRRQLPGTFWDRTAALDRLWIDGKVYVVRVRGANLVALGDAHDRRMAAQAKAEGRVREQRIL